MLRSEIMLPLGDAMAGVRVIGWSLVLIVLILVAFFVVMRMRAWLQQDDDAPVGIGFSLSDLRQLHRAGKMTDEEYEKAREKIVGAAKAMAAKLPDPLARDRRPPPPGPRTPPTI
jgi:hypothetical protein